MSVKMFCMGLELRGIHEDVESKYRKLPISLNHPVIQAMINKIDKEGVVSREEFGACRSNGSFFLEYEAWHYNGHRNVPYVYWAVATPVADISQDKPWCALCNSQEIKTNAYGEVKSCKSCESINIINPHERGFDSQRLKYISVELG